MASFRSEDLFVEGNFFRLRSQFSLQTFIIIFFIVIANAILSFISWFGVRFFGCLCGSIYVCMLHHYQASQVAFYCVSECVNCQRVTCYTFCLPPFTHITYEFIYVGRHILHTHQPELPQGVGGGAKHTHTKTSLRNPFLWIRLAYWFWPRMLAHSHWFVCSFVRYSICMFYLKMQVCLINHSRTLCKWFNHIKLANIFVKLM